MFFGSNSDLTHRVVNIKAKVELDILKMLSKSSLILWLYYFNAFES